MILLAVGIVPVTGLATVNGEPLRALAESLPTEADMRGRFLFSEVPVANGDSNVFVCEYDHAQGGGSFCFVSTNSGAGMLNALSGEAVCVDFADWSEWYRLTDASGSNSLVNIGFRRWHDGTDEAGLDMVSRLNVFLFGGESVVVQTNQNIRDLLTCPNFSVLKRPAWFFAQRDNVGLWTAAAVSNRTSRAILPNELKSEIEKESTFFDAIRPAFTRWLEDSHPDAQLFIIEDENERNELFALFSDGLNESEDGFLWNAAVWDGTTWTEASTNGISCASGICPSSFRARSSDFYRLKLVGEASRLVVLQNHRGRLRELFWETALGTRWESWNPEIGLPYSGYMGAFGFPNAPQSVFQSLETRSPFQSLERITPESIPSR